MLWKVASPGSAGVSSFAVGGVKRGARARSFESRDASTPNRRGRAIQLNWPQDLNIVYRARPSFEHRIYPTYKVATLVGVLAESGIPAAETLSGSGIAESQLLNPVARISCRQTLTVFRNALRLAPDPAFALRAGQRMRITAFGMFGYALLSSPTHAVAADLAVRYSRVTGPIVEIDFFQEDDTAIWALTPNFSADPTEDLYRIAVEFRIACQKAVYADLFGPSFRFSGAHVTYVAPAHAHLYESILECPVLFNQARNELRFDAIRMQDPMAYANPITNAMVRDICEQSLAEVNRSGGVALDIHRILVEHAGQFPEIDVMAAKLGMNERMLRRKLDAEKTSYRQILADVRMRQAIEYLRKTPMTNEEIATRLGYSDAANFRHAFTRWTHKTPSDFRVK